MRRCPYCHEQVKDTATICKWCQREIPLVGASATATLAPASTPQDVRIVATGSGAALLLTLGVIAAGLGILFLSQATSGVGLMAGACFLAIVARIVQAGEHHRAVMLQLRPKPED